MKLLVLFAALSGAALLATPEQENVNSRYTVESVELRPDNVQKRISQSLREQFDGLIGRPFDPQIVASLAGRIRRELHLVVSHRIEKGVQADHVRVIYEARERRWDEDDARVTKLAYHQKQGWTGGLELGFDAGANRFEFGMQSDADRLIERYAGLNAGYSRRFGERIRFRFDFETYHQIWDPSTEYALQQRPDVPGIYRERYGMEPAVVILLAPSLSLTTGLDFQHFQIQFPAARFEAANAVVTTLRHRRRWESADSSAGHDLDAGYSLRAATSLLDSDFIYSRHLADARYSLRYGRHLWTVAAMTGTISGEAPLFERFAIGDTRTLRGWNKFNVDPLGGSRLAHGSVQYRYGAVGIFYDTGTVWDRRENADVKHSVGVTVASGALKDGPFLTVAFPLRSGGFTPLFMLGMNF